MFHVKHFVSPPVAAMFHVKHSVSLLVVAAAMLILTGCAGVAAPEGWAAPVTAGGLVIVRNHGGTVSALKLNPDAQPTVAWTYPASSESDKPWYTKLFS